MTRRVTVKPYMGTRINNASMGMSVQALQAQFKENVGGIISALNEFTEELEGIMPEILVEGLEETFGKAISYCPEKDGDLRASAYLEAERFRGGSRAVLGFGRNGQPSYAIFVHEMPYAHKAPTRSKFLEAALDEDYYAIVGKLPRLIKEAAGT